VHRPRVVKNSGNGKIYKEAPVTLTVWGLALLILMNLRSAEISALHVSDKYMPLIRHEDERTQLARLAVTNGY
jgi:hypothetical protein